MQDQVNVEGARTPARRPRNAEATRVDILHAAGRRFARAGFAHVSLKQIADDVGITPAMIVRYFGSKQGLFEAVARDRSTQPSAPGPTEDQARTIADNVLGFWLDPDSRAGPMTLVRSADLDVSIQILREEIRTRILDLLAPVLQGPDVEMRSRLLVGVIMGFGLFTLGFFLDPDAPPLSEKEYETTAAHLTRLVAACLAEPTAES